MIRDYKDYANDILQSIKDIGSFTKRISFAKFSKDRKTINAVVRSLEIIGEASKNIPIEIKNKHARIPWKKMTGIRDKLIHEYFGIDLSIVWKVAKDEIPPLKSLVSKVLKDL